MIWRNICCDLVLNIKNRSTYIHNSINVIVCTCMFYTYIIRTYMYLLHLVVDLLKKYYHSLLASMMPEDARFDNISQVTWLNVDVATLCCMTNKQFLDTLIMRTQNNHQLLRFCSTIYLFMNNKNILMTFKSG